MKNFLFCIYVCILHINLSFAVDIKTYIPEKAKIYLPLVKEQQIEYWPDHAKPEVFGGLIEQESCISLLHFRCWSPTSKLKTSREEGAGLLQITRAYKQDGSIRFDALAELKNKHPALKEWSWSNVYTRPDLQIMAIVLKTRDDYKSLFNINDPIERLKFTDSAYNGGLRGVTQDRRACGLRKDCDPQIWFGNVEHTCMKSRKPIYGNRTACFINREHTEMVFKIRSEKYKQYFIEERK